MSCADEPSSFFSLILVVACGNVILVCVYVRMYLSHFMEQWRMNLETGCRKQHRTRCILGIAKKKPQTSFITSLLVVECDVVMFFSSSPISLFSSVSFQPRIITRVEGRIYRILFERRTVMKLFDSLRYSVSQIVY